MYFLLIAANCSTPQQWELQSGARPGAWSTQNLVWLHTISIVSLKALQFLSDCGVITRHKLARYEHGQPEAPGSIAFDWPCIRTATAGPRL